MKPPSPASLDVAAPAPMHPCTRTSQAAHRWTAAEPKKLEKGGLRVALLTLTCFSEVLKGFCRYKRSRTGDRSHLLPPLNAPIFTSTTRKIQQVTTREDQPKSRALCEAHPKANLGEEYHRLPGPAGRTMHASYHTWRYSFCNEHGACKRLATPFANYVLYASNSLPLVLRMIGKFLLYVKAV